MQRALDVFSQSSPARSRQPRLSMRVVHATMPPTRAHGTMQGSHSLPLAASSIHALTVCS